MSTRPNNFLESLANSTKNYTINISIQSNYSDKVITWLLEQYIPFSITYEGENTRDSKEESKRELLPEKVIGLDSNIETIHLKYILNNIEKPLPNLREIAREFGMSTQSFKSKFQKQYGKSFYQIHLEKKMEHAANLLKKGVTATIISERIGYSHPIKFNKMFQKHYGITPKKYQMQHRMN